ncbi:MAG TPA: EAL domain-containing protein, partial [Solirubrobacteraceae bacterium]|nr:EAL domain-containing protein [Solirubrobacteraceae bacterium]
LPAAQRTGQIAEIGHWVLAQACAQGAQWHERYEGDPIVIGVNVSLYELLNTDYATTVTAALNATGLPPTSLVLEIAEADLRGHRDVLPGKLRALLALGVRIEVDDFGLGQISLTELRELGFTGVKLDRSFIQLLDSGDPVSEAVLAALRLGRELGTLTVAEGVETWGQAHRLRSLGSVYAQGFLFGKPMPAEDLGSLIAAYRQLDVEELQQPA